MSDFTNNEIIKEDPELIKLRKFSDEILQKKINANLKFIKEVEPDYFNNQPCELVETAYYCLLLDHKVKSIKEEQNKEKLRLAEQQRLEDEEERENKRLEKEAKQKFILDNSLASPDLMDRLKFRFFNLSVKDNEEDPEGLNPASSPPFFSTKEEQFSNELQKAWDEEKIHVYFSIYNGESMIGKPEYMKKNLNKTLAATVEQHDLSKLLFVCFRIEDFIGYIDKKEYCTYGSIWITSMKLSPSHFPEFEMFDFVSWDQGEVESIALSFERTLGKNNIIDEIYAR